MGMHGRLVLLGLVLPVLVVGDARAERVLHEYVPDIAEAPTQVVGGGAEGENPAAIRVGSEEVAEPESAPALRTYRSTDPNGSNYSFEPDLFTRLDGRLGYEEEFTPSIVPFKRQKALDTVVWPGYRLVVGDPSRRPVPVVGSGASTPRRDLFWVTLKLEIGREPVPIPSASPDVRILSYRTRPEVTLRFSRDGADNLYVAAPGRRSRVPLLVSATLLTDASAAYFGAELPGDVRLADLAAPSMPSRVREAGIEVAREIGVRPTDSLREAVARLVSHFRSFEEADEALQRTGDIYRDLALGRRGVCRHRSFAFMVTANALGLRTRYVENDAHAFVEILLPDTGWMRIDLGGAAAGIDIENAANRPRHEPRRPDDLPQPEAYRRSYSLLAAPNVEGAPRPVDRGEVPPFVPPGTPGTPGGPEDPTAVPNRAEPLPPRPSDPEALPLLPTSTTIDQAATTARRGMPIHVAGRVLGRGGPLPGMLVELSLSLDGTRRYLRLGAQVTDENGRYSGEFLLPPDLAPRTYFLVAGTPGDGVHAPSQSQP